MTHIELCLLNQYLINYCRYEMEPVLRCIRDESWSLFFQKCDVGFPFLEFHAVVVEGGEVSEMPFNKWLGYLQSIDCVKIDLRHSSDT
ncbi:hypothetical protein [Microbulbifer epialgicus]|uniref:Uncharacterized protein n=1 Tax=Microbulbifer epialgicus TaxID=393907 RepID=A0ABV4NUA8_9GAMM